MMQFAKYFPTWTRIAAATTLATLSCHSFGANLSSLPTLRSSNGVLDVLMVARAAPAPSLVSGSAPTAWVYDVCPRPANGANVCPPNSANLYGGTRLAVQPGDTLKVKLVNNLPNVPDAKHSVESPYLASNPTNLHTHGLLVSPRYASTSDPTYGDNVYVLTLNPMNAPAPSAADGQHIHSDLRFGFTEYKIQVPQHHPSGMYWFHPHAHGVSLNQVSSGLAGMLTVGDVSDYVCNGATCASYAATIPVRHVLLKDTQVVPTPTGNAIMSQQDPAFCAGAAAGQGRCASTSVPGGQWVFSLNGQAYPTIPVKQSQGEIWRITAASGSATYDLHLQDAGGNDMLMQVLSIDGVAVAGPNATTAWNTWAGNNAGRVAYAPCPGAKAPASGSTTGMPVCATRIVMMPSSRVEVWVGYRDATGALVSTPAAGASATLRTVGYSTGGDTWPAIDLAQVNFAPATRPASAPVALSVNTSEQRSLSTAKDIASDLASANAAWPKDSTCRPLAAGRSRRVYYGNVTVPGRGEVFALGFEEVDANGMGVPGTLVDLHEYDPLSPSICVPLAKGNTPNTEMWQLVNLTPEDHNFHIHQLRFLLMKDPSSMPSLASPTALNGDEVAYDNLPMRHGLNACGTVANWKSGKDSLGNTCDGQPIKIAIPFAVAGDFVYHCHILEHEDGGMMATIRVRPSLN